MPQATKYKVSLTILGTEWTQKGATIDEALSLFPLDWQQIKGKGVVRIKYGKQSCEKLFTMIILRRIFGNKLSRSMWSKNLQLLLQG